MSSDVYFANGNEVQLFEKAYRRRIPVMLTGPTGCGKTRLVEHMGQLLGRPVVTISCHDDLTSSDLVGRFLVSGGDVVWTDGPLTQAVKAGAICYLDEVVEARHDSLAILHSLTDHRRSLYLDRRRRNHHGAGHLHAGLLLQPRLPELAQRAEALIPATVRHAAHAVPAAGARGAGDRRRDRHRVTDRRSAGAVRHRAAHRRPGVALRTAVDAHARQRRAAGRRKRPELEAAEACILAPLTTDGGIHDGLREVAASVLTAQAERH